MKTDSQELLQERILELEAENVVLRERIDFLEGVPFLRAGMHGETLISQLVNGKMTIHSAPHDIVVPDGRKLEVKFSRLNIPMKIFSSKRWSWNHPLGMTRAKDFDRLLLIGEADPRFCSLYRDPSSPYVIFDVPYSRVAAINQKYNHISITTSPTRAGTGKRTLLFREFQTTIKELERRYGIDRTSRAALRGS